MSSKDVEIRVKQSNQMVTIYPETSVEQVEGLSDILATIGGSVSYESVVELTAAAEQKISQVSDLLFCPMPVPSLSSGPHVYDGTEQTPVWTNYNNSRMSISGTTKATNAGTYNVTFTPILSAFRWEDTELSNARTLTWSIAKKAATSSLSANSFSIGANNLTQTITVTTDGDGEITAVSSDPTVLTTRVEGKNVILVGVNNGIGVSVTITLADGTNYTGDRWVISGDVAFIDTLANSTPELIQFVAQNDIAANYWSIGDSFNTTLTGSLSTVNGNINVNNYVMKSVLIGINHNSTKEGNHLLHFQMSKNSSGTNVALMSSPMNSTNDSLGGWEESDMRTTTISNLYNYNIPSSLKSVIHSVTKYTDNIGDGTNTAANVTDTEDNFFLLSEVELYGATTYSNSNEQNEQVQYAYYANGNSKVRYSHLATSTVAKHFLRSPSVANSTGRSIADNGTALSTENSNSNTIGFSPCYCIG